MAEREGVFKDLRFDALRNAIYHTERRSFFDLVNRLINFSVIALGASVAGKVANLFHFPGLWLELSVVLVAAAQLVFDFGSRARIHEFLQKRYYEILSEMEADNSKQRESIWAAKLMNIAADEPMAMRALDALAYNKAVDATISDPKNIAECRLHVSWYQRRLRHIVAFQGAQFLPEATHVACTSRCRVWIKSKLRLTQYD
jgi:hypothetical protein